MAEPPPIGEYAAGVLQWLLDDDLVFLAGDTARATEMAAILRAAAPDALVVHCPETDALPGDSAPPSPGNIGHRLAALRRIRSALQGSVRPKIALVSTGEAAARLYPEPQQFDAAPPFLRAGNALDLDGFAQTLAEIGYFNDDRVDEPGEMAVRGQVLDIFPADAEQPFRIEVQDGLIAQIRTYDPVSQLTLSDCDELELGRVQEPELGDGSVLLDHLPGAAVAIDHGAERRRGLLLALAADAAKRRSGRALDDICPDARWKKAFAKREILDLLDGRGDPPPRFVEARSPERAFARFAAAAEQSGDRLLLAGSARDLRFLARRSARELKREPVTVASWAEALKAERGSLLALAMPISRGLVRGDLLVVAAADLLGSRALRSLDAPVSNGARFLEAAELRLGDVVVHEDHGLAVVAGIEKLPAGEGEENGDAILIRHAEDARRLVPVAEADRLWRYGSDVDAVALDRLDGSSWKKRRGAIDAAVAETARALLALAEARARERAPALEADPAEYERFVSGFPFTETPDQLRAIEAVRNDLASGRPMDRLIVGDVGYGKTEVAVRAAAIAALAGKQVVLAAPTTVLVRQHLETFSRRFEPFGIHVAALSRLSSAAEKKEVKAGLADGSVRIVIGTGAVAAKHVEYQDLTLVIIDEEQRFGAADKKKLRELGAGHSLSMSATPIPRTLQGALTGLQQLSIIATPPARRQPIRTAVLPFDPQTMRTALLRERSRGGQSFVVVPRIEDMAEMADLLKQHVAELRLSEAHGKLPATEIDRVMVAFADGEGDVLLATNIIEAGLDVPRANTMIVWRADLFGLAQLHQLRGRVGRGSRRGHVFLVTDGKSELSPRTLARLETLQTFDRLGAGFDISARDMDLRGAGDLLGEDQAGHVKLIGLDLYQHLLQSALRSAKGEAPDHWTPNLNLGLAGHLPEDWIGDVDLRVGLYARLARIADRSSLDAFEDELVDRFGEPPATAQRLLALARLRLLAKACAIERIDAGPGAIALTPRPDFSADAAAVGLIRKNERLLLDERIDDPELRLARTESVLLALVEDQD